MIWERLLIKLDDSLRVAAGYLFNILKSMLKMSRKTPN
jgi:hypothetical protein